MTSTSSLVWDDDSQIEELHLRKRYDRITPRIELLIEALPGGT
jgi:Holliday junction resolvase RusA-like endonuclease